MSRHLPPWYLNDDFWRRTEAFVFDPISDDVTEGEVEFIVGEIGPAPAQVLDLCCGTGRHSIALATRGYAVTGVDASPYLLGRARNGAQAADISVEWIHTDARAFEGRGAFDAVICMYSSFGQFSNDASNRALLVTMKDALTTSGVAIVDVMGKEALARVFVARNWMQDVKGRILIQDRLIRDNWGRIENYWTLIEGGERIHYKIDQRLYDAKELVATMRSVGLKVEKVIGGVDGREYDHAAQRLVVVARR